MMKIPPVAKPAQIKPSPVQVKGGKVGAPSLTPKPIAKRLATAALPRKAKYRSV